MHLGIEIRPVWLRVWVRVWPLAVGLLSTGPLLWASPALGWDRRSEREPLRLQQLVDLERLSISGDQRTRYEYVSDQFAAGSPGDDQLIVLRTRVDVRLRLMDWLSVVAELQDSRAYLEDDNTPLGTGEVNTAELLRGFLQVKVDGPFGGSHHIQLGRVTMDIGRRRLVARNRYRNTTNAFTGLNWQWRDEDDRRLRAFYTLPIQRLPNGIEAIRDNEVEFDRESFKVQFFGLFYADELPWGDDLEVYGYGLHERDSSERPTRNRRLGTMGFRWERKPSGGSFDWEIQSALQFGHARASTASARDLNAFAHFQHVVIGYTLTGAWSTRVSLHYDYASGDDDPDDGSWERFDTLYGARRFEFGPSSMWGAFTRVNINTPGIRFQLRPAPTLTAMVDYRAVWLASDRDQWFPTGVRDPSGQSGSFVGSQIEARVRWEFLPDSVLLELGWAHLFAGEFIDHAPNSNQSGDADYFYTQVALKF